MNQIKLITINLITKTGKFANNKDKAREIREKLIFPSLKRGELVVLNFKDIDSATQSFIHALISAAIRTFGDDVFDMIEFKNCNESVKRVINIVAEYMQHNKE